MLFNFGKYKCFHSEIGNEAVQYQMGGNVDLLSTTVKKRTISADMKVSGSEELQHRKETKLLD